LLKGQGEYTTESFEVIFRKPMYSSHDIHRMHPIGKTQIEIKSSLMNIAYKFDTKL
ncbi:hypothetical protein AAF712_016584, partial [Marasmius tenuissimus]